MVMAKERYIAAGVITAIVFLLGLAIGLAIEGKRVTYVADQLTAERVEFSSSQIQYNLITLLNVSNNCPVINEIFYNNLERLEKTRMRVSDYGKDSKINDESFDLLKRQYTIEQVNYWLLSKKAQEACKTDFVRLIFFYSTPKDCPDCEDQATALNYIKALFNEKTLIFVIDADFIQEPIVDIMKKQYNVTKFPTVVVEDQVFDEFLSKDDLMAHICGHLKNATQCRGG